MFDTDFEDFFADTIEESADFVVDADDETTWLEAAMDIDEACGSKKHESDDLDDDDSEDDELE